MGCLILGTASLFAQPPGGGPPPGGQGDGIWRRNAYWGEAQTFDACVGHQPGNGQYHHHANPICLRAQLNDNVELARSGRNGASYREKPAAWAHSPILGWAMDGYPVYGPYGYSEARNPASAVRRIRSGFQLRNITQRTSLPDWSLPNHAGVSQQLSASQYGPAVSLRFPLGRYNEDYEWAESVGDLDQYNGRFTVTPEFPNGTYAYYVTIEADGKPAFPYLVGGQMYGSVTGGTAQTVPSNVEEYFNVSAGAQPSASQSPHVAAWMTRDATQKATVVSGYDPSAGPAEIWPVNTPTGARTSGGVTTPTNGNVQRVRHDVSNVYVNANGLSTYTMGPWFDPAMTGSIFSNFPSSLNAQYRIPRSPSESASKSASGLGAVGLWVNGVAVFNFLDGASYSNASGNDVGGGIVNLAAVQVSSASGEQGPVAPGSLVTAYSIFGAQLATSTEAASSANWPTSLGGATVTVRDSAGVSRPAAISYASPNQLNFQVPPEAASGFGTVTYSAGTNTASAGIYIVPAYPNLFFAEGNKPAGHVVRIRAGQQIVESIAAAIPARSGEDVYLVLYGSGRGASSQAKAVVGGVEAAVVYAGPQGVYSGLDQFNVLVPPAVAPGKVDVIVTVGNRPSNTVSIELQ